MTSWSTNFIITIITQPKFLTTLSPSTVVQDDNIYIHSITKNMTNDLQNTVYWTATKKMFNQKLHNTNPKKIQWITSIVSIIPMKQNASVVKNCGDW